MGLLAERAIERLGFAEIARAAGVSLAELRETFGSKIAILAAHMKQIDLRVLGEAGSDVAEELPRERLFEVLMRRIELLEPHKAAIRSLLMSCRGNPGLALALNQLGVQSQRWMLTAADIDASGLRGMMRAQGLAVLFASVLRTWVDDDDPGRARTMAVLDRSLARGQRWSGVLDGICAIARRMPGSRRSRPGRADGETLAV
jgi:AcrR family transcriptional regulator